MEWRDTVHHSPFSVLFPFKTLHKECTLFNFLQKHYHRLYAYVVVNNLLTYIYHTKPSFQYVSLKYCPLDFLNLARHLQIYRYDTYYFDLILFSHPISVSCSFNTTVPLSHLSFLNYYLDFIRKRRMFKSRMGFGLLYYNVTLNLNLMFETCDRCLLS